MDGILESGAGRAAERIVAVGVAAGAAAGLAVLAGLYLVTAPVAKEDRAYWTVSGPPCPTATRAELDRIPRPLAQVIDVGGARFARISGAVMCSGVATGAGTVIGAVCQFNGPRALAVWSKGGSALFQFPGGERATVTVSDDHPPRCVAAANFNGD